MISDGFDRRTVANMEVDLEQGCSGLSAGEGHDARRHIAARIVECATDGDVTLVNLRLSNVGSQQHCPLLLSRTFQRTHGLS